LISPKSALTAPLPKNGPDLTGLKNTLGTNLEISVSPKTDKLDFLGKRDRKSPLWQTKDVGKNSQENSRKFLREFGKYFGIQDSDRELALLKETNDQVGMSHLKYNQKLRGVPVFGGQLTVHLKDNQTVTTVNGNIQPLDQLDTAPKISQEEAIKLAKKLWAKKQKGDPRTIKDARLYIYNKKFISSQRDDTRNYLVWEVNLFSPQPYQHELIYVNARDGSLVDRRVVVKRAVDRRVYNCRPWDDYNACVLEDTLHNSDHGRSEGVGVRGITDIDNLYDYTGNIHNYYGDTFSRLGANSQGGLGDNITNSYGKTDSYGKIDYDPWRGVYCPDNAFFDVNPEYGGATINFCEGSATKDVVGHEYAHGLSYFSILDGYGDPSGLTYAYESGALEEANADVFGEAAENYMNGSSDWLIGEDIASGPFRSMSSPASIIDPGIGSYPERFNSGNFYCDIWDNGGVHHNSTVVTHAAYLMAMGGNFNGCSVGAIGRAKEEAVFYRAITQYLTTISEFNDAYLALNSACADLYGAGSDDCVNVKKALRSVEMNQGGMCSGLSGGAPDCDFTSAPTITKVSSTIEDGSYNAGSVIDINVAFSDLVTATGSVTINLNTGRSCMFNITNSLSSSCNYIVDPADNTNSLEVASITGTITDQDGNALVNFLPASSLSQNNRIMIDNISPTIVGVADGQVYESNVVPIFDEGTATLNNASFSSGQNISADGDYLLVVTDEAGNSTSVEFTIEKIITDDISPTISGVADGQVYRTDVAPIFDEGTATLNDASFSSGQNISADGDYLLVVTDEAGNSTSVEFTIEKIVSSISSLPYSAKKANRRISFSVYGLNLPGKLKAKGFVARLNGRRLKILSVRNMGQYTLVNTRQNFRKWPAGDYRFDLKYGYKIRKTWYRGSVSKDYILTIN